MTAVKETGEVAFIAGLQRCGCLQYTQNGIVVFSVIPIEGEHAGQPVETGVSSSELEGWPTVPPHWVHLPEYVSVGATNSRPSGITGWLMHSRKISNWGNAQEPVQAWLAHVRSVLGGS